jgi:hypothetical protein
MGEARLSLMEGFDDYFSIFVYNEVKKAFDKWGNLL